MDLSEIPAVGGRRHPWEVSRFRFFAGVLRRAGLLAKPLRVLDVGAGDGWFARELHGRLPPGSRTVCWDAAYTDADLERMRADGDVGVDCTRSRPTGTFDLVTMLDVLEHVEHDVPFLASVVAEHVGPQSWALVSVPAWMSLYCDRDRALRHFRRYSRAGFADLLTGAGLVLRTRGGAFHSGVLPRFLTATRERVRPTPHASAGPLHHELTWDHGRLMTGACVTALRMDNAVSSAAARLRLPVPGLTEWALCRR